MKEQAAPAGAPPVLRRLDRETLRRALVPALFIALALLVTSGYGSGVQLNDGQAELHLDPLKFLWSLLHAWNPALYLGTHTGYWFPYEMPYGWLYAGAQIFGIPQGVAQRVAVFAVYLACISSMYYCLRSVAPWIDETARIAGSVAYLFNMYVALNSQAQVVWLLTYATLPAMIGVTARALRGETNVWRAALSIALLVLVGGGVNPPLVAINAILLALFVVIAVAFDSRPALVLSRALPFVAAASVATVAVNLYWIVPFVDFFRGVWLNGILSEAPSLHNAATSFDNVLRGLGHWATFISFGGRAYFPWSQPYAQGFFSALLWFVPIVALGAVIFKRNQRSVTLYFLIATIVSVPIVVGYYHDALGDAVTTPIYDAFYRYLPGFQMFRFSYKWVAGVEFGLCGLYALATFAVLASLREALAPLATLGRRRLNWVVPAAGALLVAVPILAFVPVLVNKMNYPGSVLPSWEFRESALVGTDDQHRVALLPTQFLEQYDWGNPQFYIENSLIDRPLVYGLLGSEPSEGSDVWVRRAYRAMREGLPFAADMFRVLGVDTFLERDDFVPAIDFSSPDEARFNSITLTHDLLHRVLIASPQRSEGPLRTYRLRAALPLVYGVNHPVVSTAPTFTDAYLGDVDAMARGEARFDPPTRVPTEFANTMRALSPILPLSGSQVRDLAVNQALPDGILVRAPAVAEDQAVPFEVRTGGDYVVFAREQSLLFARLPPQTLSVDNQNFTPQSAGGWTRYGEITLSAGRHTVSDGYIDPYLVVALVKADDLAAQQAQIAALQQALPQNLALAEWVGGRKRSVLLPFSGRYRVAATAVSPFAPDVSLRVRLSPARYGGVFPQNLSATLPYVFGGGVAATSQILMPESWYRDDSTVYRWQRGDPQSWFLLARESHVRVFVPGDRSLAVQATMRISRLQVGSVMTVDVNGQRQQNVTLAGLRAGSQEYDTLDGLAGPAPVPVILALSLRPGWNDVAFVFSSATGERGDLGPDVISAAVAPDLSFRRVGESGASQPLRDASFGAREVPPPPRGLAGDPGFAGTVALSGNGNLWLGVAIAGPAGTAYRLFPLPATGAFDIDFIHAFPNGWDKGRERIAGLWVLWRGQRPWLTDLHYNVRAIPALALAHPQALASPPITIDGRPIASQTVALSRGKHVVGIGDRNIKIGFLTIDPVTLPRTQPFEIGWERYSPTALEVTVAANAAPFLLVFGEAYHPEWSASVDGAPLRHVVVNGLSNGWIVPSLPQGGRVAIVFVAQRAYDVAAGISLIALILLVVLAIRPELWPLTSEKP